MNVPPGWAIISHTSATVTSYTHLFPFALSSYHYVTTKNHVSKWITLLMWAKLRIRWARRSSVEIRMSHDMKTLSALLVLCEANPPVTDGYPLKEGVRCFLCYWLLNKQSSCLWFDTHVTFTLMPPSLGTGYSQHWNMSAAHNYDETRFRFEIIWDITVALSAIYKQIMWIELNTGLMAGMKGWFRRIKTVKRHPKSDMLQLSSTFEPRPLTISA